MSDSFKAVAGRMCLENTDNFSYISFLVSYRIVASRSAGILLSVRGLNQVSIQRPRLLPPLSYPPKDVHTI